MAFSNLDLPTGDHVVGIDLGGSYVRALLCDLDGREVRGAVEATPTRDATSVIAAVAGLARTVAEQAEVDFARVAGLAVGVPAVAHPTAGTLRLAPNLPSFGDRDVVNALHDELGVPVAIDNDVNMATRAEHRRGLGAGTRDFAFIAVGTGVGMGIVAGGQLQRGATGAAGEVAMLPLGTDSVDPGHGSLEEVAGGAGLARRYARRTGAEVAPAGELDLFAAAAAGDAHAAELVSEQALALALAVVAVHGVLDPALVVFGGGIGARTDVVARVRAHLPGLTLHEIRVEASALGERAGLVGAAELARELAARNLDVVGGER